MSQKDKNVYKNLIFVRVNFSKKNLNFYGNCVLLSLGRKIHCFLWSIEKSKIILKGVFAKNEMFGIKLIFYDPSAATF